MDEHLLYSILKYNKFNYDYSSLFDNKHLQQLCIINHKKQISGDFCELIEQHFSRLYYLHIIAGPPTQNEIDRIFSSMDFHGLFQRPAYYDISVYIKIFKEFDTYALNSYLYETPYPYIEKKFISKKYKSTLIESLTLC